MILETTFRLEVLLKPFGCKVHFVIFFDVWNIFCSLLHTFKDQLEVHLVLSLKGGSWLVVFLQIRVQLCEAFQLRVRVDLRPKHIFTDVSDFLLANEPSSCINVFELDIFARVGFIASHYNRKEHAIPYPDVLQLDVSYIDSRLSLASAFGVKRVQHASRPSLIRLFLLLWTKIDSPPYRLMHGDVFVKDIVDNPISISSRIGLQVDSLERLLHYSITKSDISDAVDLRIWRYGAYSQTHSQSNSNVFDQHILSTIGRPITIIMRRLGYNNVVIILAGDVIDVEITSIGINSISIEGKHRNSANQVESLEDAQLCRSIDANVNIKDGHINATTDPHVEAWRILKSEVMNFQLGNLVYSKQMRPAGSSRGVFFCDKPAVQPPNVSPSVYLTSSIDGNVTAVLYLYEILIVQSISVVWPMLDAIAG